MNKIIIFIIISIFSISNVFANNLPYDFESVNYIPIKLSITKPIATDEDIQEGQEVEFKVKKNVYGNGCIILKKDEIVKAKIETIITRGMNGFPAEIIISNFKFKGIQPTQTLDTYTKVGKNYALLVYPLKWALTPIPFVGSLTNLILGGEARISPDDTIVIKYYPQWK